MGAMMYALLREDSGARVQREEAAAAASSSSASSSPSPWDAPVMPDAGATTATDAAAAAPFLTLDGRQVKASNVPSFMLANSGLDNEQKLQVALCRRQAWLRAVQLGPAAMLWSYAACVLTDASGLAKLPRGSRTAVPLGAGVLGATLGAYWGGLEGKPMMNAALMSAPIEGVHKKRGKQEVCARGAPRNAARTWRARGAHAARERDVPSRYYPHHLTACMVLAGCAGRSCPLHPRGYPGLRRDKSVRLGLSQYARSLEAYRPFRDSPV